jgi:hypothetical protein
MFAKQREQSPGHTSGTLARANDKGVMVKREARRVGTDPDAELARLPGERALNKPGRINGRDRTRKKGAEGGTREGGGHRCCRRSLPPGLEKGKDERLCLDAVVVKID